MLRQAPPAGQIPAMMKAWALFAPDDLRPVTKPVPRPDLAEALVKVEAVAICGTDLEILHRGLPAMVDGKPPFDCQHVIGHEYAGTVVAVGSTVDEFSIGDRGRHNAQRGGSGPGPDARCRRRSGDGVLGSSHRHQ